MDDLLDSNPQDAVLVLGDTNSCISLLEAKEKESQHFIWRQGIDVLI